MKHQKYFSNAALAIVLGIALGACLIARTLVPLGVLPKLDIPGMALLSLAALLLEHYLAPGPRRFDFAVPALAVLTFGLLPYTAGLATAGEALKLAIVGGIVFTVTSWLYASVLDRLSTGPVAKAAPVFSALGLFLAAQCFSGILL